MDGKRPPITVSLAAMLSAQAAGKPKATPWKVPQSAPGVLPEGAGMAMDSQLNSLFDFAGSSYSQSTPGGVGIEFLGFPFLSELAQISEYRRLALTLSQEMTRAWCKITSSGDDDKSLKIKLLEGAMKRYRVRDVFREAAEMDALFGKAHIYCDFGVSSDDPELATPMIASPKKIKKGGLRRIKTLEPLWTAAGQYESSNPLSDSFYRPDSWWVMGRLIHRTRLLTLVSREVPDLLKPVRQFGGISLSELAMPVIQNWHRTRQSVSDLLHSFTVWQLETSLQSTLMGDNGNSLSDRAALFNLYRDNRGLLITDKETEGLNNISVPLSGLDALQAQALELQATIDGMPLVILLGSTPHGLGATAEPEMDAWRNRIRAQQEHLFNAPLKTIMDYIQVSEFGEVDPDISFEWNSLVDPDPLQEANIRKLEADSYVELINAGVLSPEEIRQHLASQEDSPYSNIDVSDVPEPPEDPNADPFGMSAEPDPNPEQPPSPSIAVPETPKPTTAPPNPRPDAP